MDNKEEDFKKIEIWEPLLALLLFGFMIMHPRYLGLREGLNLLPITLLSLPMAFLFIYALINRKIKRETLNLLLVIAFFILYLGIKIFRGMDSIGKEGDRDDALYQSIMYFLQGVYPFDKDTFICPAPITAGPASVLFSLPFVVLFNNINILFSFVIMFIVFYLWRYVEKENPFPILTMALAVMAFFPHFNWCYWECAEDILCGWPFIYLSVLVFLRGFIKKVGLRFFVIGAFLGISIMVRPSYAFPVLVVLFFISKGGFRALSYAALGIVLTITLLSFPFFILNPNHFLYHYLWGSTWYGRGNYEAAFFLTVIAAYLYLTAIRKFPADSQLHILIALSAIIGHVYSNLLLIPWHVYYWMIPLLVALPFFGKTDFKKTD